VAKAEEPGLRRPSSIEVQAFQFDRNARDQGRWIA